ncbi:MAG: hypothetical protein IJ642_09975 [Oscillospiraceae bacterium]|nr:hypothetical protein [Oscillospiraceae bacterium]
MSDQFHQQDDSGRSGSHAPATNFLIILIIALLILILFLIGNFIVIPVLNQRNINIAENQNTAPAAAVTEMITETIPVQVNTAPETETIPIQTTVPETTTQAPETEPEIIRTTTVPETTQPPETQPPVQKITSVPAPSTCLWMGTGTPASGDGFLNLRSSKSTSSDSNIITAIPNGAEISMFWIDDDSWIYVEYGSFSGYVKESYTVLTDPQGLWADGPGDDEPDAYVDDCYRTGQINGKGVAGFTSDYVVHHGAKTTVRETLGDTWHVTAKHSCYSMGIQWYELWDTDDGDYYGWVDDTYIWFYSIGYDDSNDNDFNDYNEVETYSCWMTGEINGTGVTGYSSEYVVKCGNRSVIRDTLGNHWHVTAKNYCYSQGVTWYELWDTDDGDYYGWVDSDYIWFY